LEYLYLKFSDGSWDEITFDDVMKLIPKSWWQKEAEQVALAEYCCLLEARETACGLSKVNIPGTKFTEPTDWSSMFDGARSGVLDESCET
jgi:hypothetical protein